MEKPSLKVPHLLILGAIALTHGCANQGYSVVAISNTTLGVAISEQPANGGVEASLGYRRQEFAFVPTNRAAAPSAAQNKGEASVGGGAKDSANVLMELKYGGGFMASSSTGIYQRLAVGESAVQNTAAALLFAKGDTDEISEKNLQAIKNLETVPTVDTSVAALRASLSRTYQAEIKADPSKGALFDEVAQCGGYANWKGLQNDTALTADKKFAYEHVATCLQNKHITLAP